MFCLHGCHFECKCEANWHNEGIRWILTIIQEPTQGQKGFRFEKHMFSMALVLQKWFDCFATDFCNDKVFVSRVLHESCFLLDSKSSRALGFKKMHKQVVRTCTIKNAIAKTKCSNILRGSSCYHICCMLRLKYEFVVFS